jgi:hypothetical protein
MSRQFRKPQAPRAEQFTCPLCKRYHEQSFSTHICPEHGAFDNYQVQRDPGTGLPAPQDCPVDVVGNKGPCGCTKLRAETYTCYICRYTGRPK